MKHILFFYFLILVSTSTLAQTYYEPGYFIDENGTITEGLIKNLDWKSNPTKFTYKEAEESESYQLDISTIKEFGIGTYFKFIRAKVNIDKSSDNINQLDKSRTPNFKEETVFLKVLLEGDATLYQYKAKNLNRYFYSVKGSKIEQLIYRRFLIGESIVVDRKFIDQLKFNLECVNFEENIFSSLQYSDKDLLPIFVSYSQCKDITPRIYIDKRKKDLLNLSIKPGISINSFAINQSDFITSSKRNFEKSLNFKFGVEAEFLLPYNNTKWAIIIEPTFQTYSTEEDTSSGIKFTFKYQSIEIPVGLRYRMFLNKENILYLNAFFVYDLSLQKELKYGNSKIEILTLPNILLGLGFKKGEKFTVEYRISTNRHFLTQPDGEFISKYSYSSLVLGYNLF